MITQIKLQNFKCFSKKTSFPLNKLNLLTGINGQGKSTLLQSILLMRQTVEHNFFSEKIILNGNLFLLGNYNDIKNINSPDEKIFMSFTAEDNSILSFGLIRSDDNSSLIINEWIVEGKLYFTDKIKNTEKENKANKISLVFDKDQYSIYINDKITSVKIKKPFYKLICDQVITEKGYLNNSLNFEKTHYISADRIGPLDFYKKTDFGDFIDVGGKGEHVANVLYKKKKLNVQDKLHLFFEEGYSKTLEDQTGYWLSKILDTKNVKVFVEETKGNILILSFKFGNNQIHFKPANIGFGFSYILPIVVSGLIAQAGEILIVENPEAHLHPKAQHELTLFLAKVASTGVQVFIETHSEHILNAGRISTLDKDNILKNDEISILYFQDNEKEPFVQIPILKNGTIENWPEGFFDQTEIDFNKLIGF